MIQSIYVVCDEAGQPIWRTPLAQVVMGVPGDLGGVVIGFSILGIFLVPLRRCEPRGRGVRVTAPPFEGTQMIRQGATWPAKLGTLTGRRAMPDFCHPVTTLAGVCPRRAPAATVPVRSIRETFAARNSPFTVSAEIRGPSSSIFKSVSHYSIIIGGGGRVAYLSSLCRRGRREGRWRGTRPGELVSTIPQTFIENGRKCALLREGW
jgi:hypothetical protein